jgi:hypothetical protein
MNGENVPVNFMKAYREREVWFHSFLTSALNGGEWSKILPIALPSRKQPWKKEAEWAPGPVWLLQRKGTSLAPLWKSNQHSSVTQPTVYSHYNE